MAICKPSYWVPNKMRIKTWGEEKFPVLLLTNKVFCATCGDQEHHAGAASALSDSSSTSCAASFLQASKLFLESTKRNLLQEKKGFSDKREEIQNQLKNQNLKPMIIVDGRKTHNLKSASLGTWLRTIALGGSHLDFPAGLNGKESPVLQETWVQSLGQEDCLEEGMATHSSVLAWRIPWTGESGGLQSTVVQRVGHTKWLTLLPFHITLETVPQCWGSSLKT